MKKQFTLSLMIFCFVTQIALSDNIMNWQAIKKDSENFGQQRYDISLWMALTDISNCYVKGPTMGDYEPAVYLERQDRWNWRSDNLSLIELQQQGLGDWYLKIIDPNSNESICAFTVSGTLEDSEFLPVPDILEPADGDQIFAEGYVMSWDPNNAQFEADAQITEISGEEFLYKSFNYDVSSTAWYPGPLETGEAKCAVVYLKFRPDMISFPSNISGPVVNWDVFTAFLDSVDENHFIVKDITGDPFSLLDELIQKVIDLGLNHGTENSLLVKLNSAIKSLESGNTNTTINSLMSFIHAVSAQSGKKITEEDANALISAAQNIIDILNSKEEQISDHVFGIAIETEYDYNDPDYLPDGMTYDFQMDISTDVAVSSIEFLTPAGNTYLIPKIPEQCNGDVCTSYELEEDVIYNWNYYARFPSPAGWVDYGDGNYIFTFYYPDGSWDQTTVWFGIPGTTNPIPQPQEQPVLTSPSNHDAITLPVTFTWEPCTDPNAANIEVWIDNLDTGDDIGTILPVSSTSWDDVIMPLGEWDLGLAFMNSYYVPDNGDGIPIWLYKYSTSDYLLTVTSE